MGSILNAIILGIVQGLTEFLPVSSSGHLELAKYILGEDSVGEESLLMTVSLHVATALATIVVFRKDIAQIFRGLFQFKWNEETRFSLKIIISMIPAALVGLLFEEQIEQLFNKQILLVGFALLITGLLLYFADRAKLTNKPVGFWDSLIVGIAQAIAILPGISRSGATISSCVLLGIDRERAARFSFLMVVPLILAKIAKDLLDGEIASQSSSELIHLSAGFIAAFVTGLFACIWMIRLVKRSKLTYFSIYCFMVGVIAIALALFNKG
ncbi:MAG: undecaprenyl-diphosphate phosphatase [Saprospiraceae bacterium]|nr:undecaprenyl-diphosphate phosphatase [Saprospiraceae bacterium]